MNYVLFQACLTMMIKAVNGYEVNIQIRPAHVVGAFANNNCGNTGCNYYLLLHTSGKPPQCEWDDNTSKHRWGDGRSRSQIFNDGDFRPVKVQYSNLDQVYLTVCDFDGAGVPDDIIKQAQLSTYPLKAGRSRFTGRHGLKNYITIFDFIIILRADCKVTTPKSYIMYNGTHESGDISIPLNGHLTFVCENGKRDCNNPHYGVMSCNLDAEHLSNLDIHDALTCTKGRCPSFTGHEFQVDPSTVDRMITSCPEGKAVNKEPPFAIHNSHACICSSSGTAVWEPEVFPCSYDVSCDPLPGISNGSLYTNNRTIMQLYNPTDRIAQNDSINLECDNGFLPSQAAMNCTLNDTGSHAFWSGEGVCKELNCPPIAVVKGSIHNPSNKTYLFNTMWNIDCGNGYLAVPDLVECRLAADNRSVSWSNTNPVCRPIECNAPSNPQHGKYYLNNVQVVATDKVPHSQQVVLECDVGFKFNGNARTIRCLLNNMLKTASWSVTAAQCLGITCIVQAIPNNSQLISSANILKISDAVSHSQAVMIQCNHGYQLDGGALSTCTLDDATKTASWLGTQGLCKVGRHVKYKVVEQFNSQSNFNGTFVDTSTLLGQLSLGMVDWTPYRLILSEKRASYIDYGLQTSEGSICLFMGTKWIITATTSNSSYFYRVFDKQINLFFIIMLILYIVIKLTVASTLFNKREPFPWFRRFSFGMASICFVLFYNNNLKANFMSKKYLQLPFCTTQELAKLVRTDNYHLVLDSIDDYRLEMINNSNTALRHALIPSKVKLIKSRPKLWDELNRVRGAFTINSWSNFLRMNQSKVHNIIEVCPAELQKLKTAYSFPKHSNLVNLFNRRAHFVYGLTTKLSRSKEHKRNYYAHGSGPVSDGYNKLRLENTNILFCLYFTLLFVSILMCGGEIVYSKIDKMKLRIAPA